LDILPFQKKKQLNPNKYAVLAELDGFFYNMLYTGSLCGNILIFMNSTVFCVIIWDLNPWI